MQRNLIILFILLSISSFAQNITLSDSIPFIINEQNTLFVKAVFNEIDTLHLNFDTGTTELLLTNEVLKNKLQSKPQLYSTSYNLKIGNTNYATKVYDVALSGHGTDGRFGWDFFKDKIVEINYDKNLLIVHSVLPKNITRNKKFTQLKIEFFEDLFWLHVKLSKMV